MKKTVFLLLAVALCLTLAACANIEAAPAQDGENQCEPIPEPQEPYRMEITDVSATEISFVVINDTDIYFIYGLGFNLAVKEDGEWRYLELREGVAVPLRGLGVPPHSQSEEARRFWGFFEDGLPPGEYLFRMKSFENEEEPRPVTDCMLYWIEHEFTIP
jgi:hypothetical protein